MSLHNVFSDTELGGKLLFRQAPAAGTSPVSFLGLPAAVAGIAETQAFSAASLKTFLGISGTTDEFAYFATGNTLASGLMKRIASGPGAALTVDFLADLNLQTDKRVYMQTRTAAGTDPTKLQIAAFDSGQLKIIQPPPMLPGKIYYLQMVASGFAWSEQDPGGGGSVGVTGTGDPGRAAKWATSTSLMTSNLELSNTYGRIYGDFQIWLNNQEAFAWRYIAGGTKQWFVDVTYMPTYSGAIPGSATALINEGNFIKGAPPGILRGWIDAYSTTEVQSLLAGYLPLTAGTTKPLVGDLAVVKATPAVLLKDTTGNTMGMKNVAGTWSVFTVDRNDWSTLRSGLDYDSGNGTFKVWQLSGTWQAFTVATQAWALATIIPGIQHASPSDNLYYASRNGGWQSFPLGIQHANPTDGLYYASFNGAWRSFSITGGGSGSGTVKSVDTIANDGLYATTTDKNVDPRITVGLTSAVTAPGTLNVTGNLTASGPNTTVRNLTSAALSGVDPSIIWWCKDTLAVDLKFVMGGVVFPMPLYGPSDNNLYALRAAPPTGGVYVNHHWEAFVPGIQHASPSDNLYYASRNGGWVSFTPGGGGGGTVTSVGASATNGLTASITGTATVNPTVLVGLGSAVTAPGDLAVTGKLDVAGATTVGNMTSFPVGGAYPTILWQCKGTLTADLQFVHGGVVVPIPPYGGTGLYALREGAGPPYVNHSWEPFAPGIQHATSDTQYYASRNGGWVPFSPSGGSGTVTSVGTTVTNGVTATVTNPTTTPSIAIGLGPAVTINPTGAGSLAVSGTTTANISATVGSFSITSAVTTGEARLTINNATTGPVAISAKGKSYFTAGNASNPLGWIPGFINTDPTSTVSELVKRTFTQFKADLGLPDSVPATQQVPYVLVRTGTSTFEWRQLVGDGVVIT